MAWNEPGKGGKDPWRGKDPGSEVEAFVNRLKGMFGGGGGRRSGGRGPAGGFGPLGWIAALIVIWLVFNSFQLIDERQRGVVLRFGEFSRTMQPGPNFKWPWPIERVYKVDATSVRQFSDQVRVLTRDENLVEIGFNVQYQVAEPQVFLFGSRDPDQTLSQAAEAAVREVVGTSGFDQVLYERAELNQQARDKLQASLEVYRTGLAVTEVNLQNARPPDEVKPSFDDAISAREDKQRAENEAEAYASKIVPEARGDAARIRTEAEGYKAAAIARAQGDAERFSLLAAEYRKAPEVTRRRLYLETMQEVLARNPKVLAASKGNNVLYLPLDSVAPGGTGGSGADLPIMRLPAAGAALPGDSGSNLRPERSSRPSGREEPRR